MEIVTIHENNISLLKEFLSIAGNSLESFRYYEHRGFEVLENHLLTIVAVENDQPIGYGHLDKEEETVWLGIALGEGHTGKGLGKKLMQALISNGKTLEVKEISLSVDRENIRAIALYMHFGFQLQKELEKILFLSLIL